MKKNNLIKILCVMLCVALMACMLVGCNKAPETSKEKLVDDNGTLNENLINSFKKEKLNQYEWNSALNLKAFENVKITVFGDIPVLGKQRVYEWTFDKKLVQAVTFNEGNIEENIIHNLYKNYDYNYNGASWEKSNTDLDLAEALNITYLFKTLPINIFDIALSECEYNDGIYSYDISQEGIDGAVSFKFHNGKLLLVKTNVSMLGVSSEFTFVFDYDNSKINIPKQFKKDIPEEYYKKINLNEPDKPLDPEDCTKEANFLNDDETLNLKNIENFKQKKPGIWGPTLNNECKYYYYENNVLVKTILQNYDNKVYEKTKNYEKYIDFNQGFQYTRTDLDWKITLCDETNNTYEKYLLNYLGYDFDEIPLENLVYKHEGYRSKDSLIKIINNQAVYFERLNYKIVIKYGEYDIDLPCDQNYSIDNDITNGNNLDYEKLLKINSRNISKNDWEDMFNLDKNIKSNIFKKNKDFVLEQQYTVNKYLYENKYLLGKSYKREIIDCNNNKLYSLKDYWTVKDINKNEYNINKIKKNMLENYFGMSIHDLINIYDDLTFDNGKYIYQGTKGEKNYKLSFIKKYNGYYAIVEINGETKVLVLENRDHRINLPVNKILINSDNTLNTEEIFNINQEELSFSEWENAFEKLSSSCTYVLNFVDGKMEEDYFYIHSNFYMGKSNLNENFYHEKNSNLTYYKKDNIWHRRLANKDDAYNKVLTKWLSVDMEDLPHEFYKFKLINNFYTKTENNIKTELKFDGGSLKYIRITNGDKIIEKYIDSNCDNYFHYEIKDCVNDKFFLNDDGSLNEEEYNYTESDYISTDERTYKLRCLFDKNINIRVFKENNDSYDYSESIVFSDNKFKFDNIFMDLNTGEKYEFLNSKWKLTSVSEDIDVLRKEVYDYLFTDNVNEYKFIADNLYGIKKYEDNLNFIYVFDYKHVELKTPTIGESIFDEKGNIKIDKFNKLKTEEVNEKNWKQNFDLTNANFKVTIFSEVFGIVSKTNEVLINGDVIQINTYSNSELVLSQIYDFVNQATYNFTEGVWNKKQWNEQEKLSYNDLFKKQLIFANLKLNYERLYNSYSEFGILDNKYKNKNVELIFENNKLNYAKSILQQSGIAINNYIVFDYENANIEIPTEFEVEK